MRTRKGALRAKEAAEKFGTGQDRQGLKRVCENSILEGHGFSRAVNSLRASGLY